MENKRNLYIIGALVFFLIACSIGAFFGGVKQGVVKGFEEGYQKCLDEFSPDGQKMFPDPWKTE